MLTKAVQDVLNRLDSLDNDAPEWSIRLDAVEQMLDDSANRGGFKVRFDAAGAVWFRRELERIRLTTIAERFPEMPMADGRIIPIRSTIPRGYKSETYYVERLTGVAKWVAVGSWDDIERSDVYFEKRTYTRERFALGYGWDTAEIESANATGKPLRNARARANRRGMAVKLNSVGLHGSQEHGYYGFFSHPNVPVAFAPAGAGGSYRWSTPTGGSITAPKTIAEMKADLILLRRLMRTYSNNVHKMAKVFLPPSYMEALTAFVTGTAVMGLEVLQKAFPGVTFTELDDCETGGSNGGPCIMALANLTEEELWLEATPYEEVGPWQENPFRFTQTGVQETGGVICTHPRGMAKLEFPAEPA